MLFREVKPPGNEMTAGIRSTFLILMLALSSLSVSARLMVIEKLSSCMDVSFFYKGKVKGKIISITSNITCQVWCKIVLLYIVVDVCFIA